MNHTNPPILTVSYCVLRSKAAKLTLSWSAGMQRVKPVLHTCTMIMSYLTPHAANMFDHEFTVYDQKFRGLTKSLLPCSMCCLRNFDSQYRDCPRLHSSQHLYNCYQIYLLLETTSVCTLWYMVCWPALSANETPVPTAHLRWVLRQQRKHELIC